MVPRLLPNTEAKILVEAIKTKRSNRERNLKEYPNGLDDLPFDEWYCRKCKVLKSKYDFYYNPKMQKVLGNLCKKCLSKRNGERIKKLNYNRVSDDTLVRYCY